MHRSAHRYLIGLIAFAATVTLLTEGIVITIAALAACALAIYGDRLLSFERRPRRQSRQSRAPRSAHRAERERYQLVPDEPSLILGAEL